MSKTNQVANDFAYETKIIEIKNKKYTIQNQPARWCTQHVDRCTKNRTLNLEKYIEGLFEACIIDPITTMDNVGQGTMQELVNQIEALLQES